MTDRALARRDLPDILDGTCRVCGRNTEETTGIGERRVPMCPACQRLGYRYVVRGNSLLMLSDDEVVAEHPLAYTDHHFRDMQMEGKLGDWIKGASLDALTTVWEIAEQDRQRIQEIKYRIAATLHKRMAFYGGHWQVHAARILRHNEDVVRTYAYLWERLGEFIEDDPRLMELGYDLLRHAAFAEDPKKQLDIYVHLRDVGTPVKTILANPDAASISGAEPQIQHPGFETTSVYGSGLDAKGRPLPSLCRHEYESRCRHCGAVRQEEVQA